MPPKFRVLYLVHDVADAAVARRTAMLQAGGANITIMGFRRTVEPVAQVSGCTVIDLGQTHNGRFAQRIGAVIAQVLALKKHRAAFENADLIIARNLEMLAIAVRGRALAAGTPVLVYECLDIHRLMLNRGPVGKSLRRLEGWLSRRASALITSSPAFVRSYFETLSQVRLHTRLVENKAFGLASATVSPRPPGPPWRIGWFGAIRCRDSLRILADLVAESAGTVEVVIRGRPALDQFDNFASATTALPGLIFAGPYVNPGDLAAIYGDVHFTWAIDRFEAGLNSSWLLPNRLYEGGAFASVPIAETSVETGRFLERLGIGVMLDAPLELSLTAFFASLTETKYRALEAAVRAAPRETWVCDEADCVDLVGWLQNLKAPP